MPAKSQNIEDYIQPLHINGMDGRMLYLPPKRNQTNELLVIYGHHSSLERWWGLAQNFNDVGGITMPDLPGFGGMDSFYKIGRHATLDNYADYMAAFVKMRYRRKKVIIVGISFGFLVATRMLQRYPELTGRVTMLISAMGFMHKDNFLFSPTRYNLYRYTAEAVSLPPLPFVFRHTVLTAPVLKAFYARTNNAKHKFKIAQDNPELRKAIMDMEVTLWQNNDARTWTRTTVELLTVDNTTVKVNIPVWHVHTPHDNYFDNDVIEQQMRVVFSTYQPVIVHAKAHSPSVVATKKEAAAFMPKELRDMLKGQSKSARRRRK